MSQPWTMKRIHDVKSWPHIFEAVLAGAKTHELRRNDRDYRVGDILILHEYFPDTKKYTGRKLAVEITYITSEKNPCAISEAVLKGGFCILSIKLLNDSFEAKKANRGVSGRAGRESGASGLNVESSR